MEISAFFAVGFPKAFTNKEDCDEKYVVVAASSDGDCSG